jgi:predicted porin
VKARSSREVSKEVSREVSRQVAATRVAGAPAPSNSLISYSPIGVSVNNGVARAFLEKEKGDKLNFTTPNGEILLYGNLDVSGDATTKGISGLRAPGLLAPGTSAPQYNNVPGNYNTPVGNVGWLGAITSSKSFVGVRGFQNIGSTPFKLVYQLETAISLASEPGTKETNSNQSNVVSGGLTSRNSFIGISSPEWGILRVGKTDTPYAQSTSRLDPFSGMLGSYSVVMGNSGGDNRVEFGGRLDHSIWYESPNVRGFKFAALFSPGQNRGYQNDNIAAGESDCTGGNIPGSGGTFGLQGAGNPNCSDGSYGNAASASLTYTHGPLYAVAAYERHFGVNRSSDITGLGGNAPYYVVQGDTADEDAAKVAVQYELPTHTTISGIFESLHRYVPDYLQFQNERQRLGTWLAIEQKLTDKDSVAVGWAHAFRTPGDPGQHNTSLAPVPYPSADPTLPGDMTGGAGKDNSANMFSAVYKRKIAPGLTFYTNAAATINAQYAHYDLGAGGHGVTTDAHDGYGAAGGIGSGPHIWAGGHLFGVSTGLNYAF